MPETYKRTPNIVCKVCNKAIYRRPCEIKKGNVFCSIKCHGIFLRIEVPCVVCGKILLKGENKKTCSRACANIHRAGIKYIGAQLHSKVSNYRFLKQRLVELRGSLCERCNFSVLDILQVHHKDRNRNNNDVHNLELLCPNCHFSEHYLKN